jgi:phosphohistidine phosphatase
VVRELSDDLSSVILVGHNPGVEELVRLVTGADIEMPTSAIAVIAMAGSWVEADEESGTLLASGRPPG